MSPGGRTETDSRCRPCAPGRFAAKEASQQCADCPLNTYSPGTSASAPAVGCVPCNITGNTTRPGTPAVARSLLVIYYLLLVTCYLLLVTCYLLFITCYLLLVTCYLLLVTCYLLLVTHNSLLITHYFLLITYYILLVT